MKFKARSTQKEAYTRFLHKELRSGYINLPRREKKRLKRRLEKRSYFHRKLGYVVQIADPVFRIHSAILSTPMPSSIRSIFNPLPVPEKASCSVLFRRYSI